MKRIPQKNYQQLFLRIALGATLLSAVADRLGFWPAAYSSWGNMERFVEYTGKITAFLPASLTHFNAYAATVTEIVLGVLLVLGFKTKWAAVFTGVFLLLCALSMSLTLGIKSAFDYSVWVGCAGAFLLATQTSFTISIDHLLKNRIYEQKN